MRVIPSAALLGIILASLIITLPASAAVYTYQGSSDADMIECGYLQKTGSSWSDLVGATPGRNYGDANYFSRLVTSTTSNSWNYVSRAYSIWNTSDIPDNETVTSAYLDAYIAGVLYTFKSSDMFGVIDLHSENSFLGDETHWDLWETYSDDGTWYRLSSYSAATGQIIEFDPGAINVYGVSTIGIMIGLDDDYCNNPSAAFGVEFPAWASNKWDAIDIAFSSPSTRLYVVTSPPPTAPPETIAVNLYEKYSNAVLINQAVTATPTTGGAGETKTSLYGETKHFDVVPGLTYWFNASRPGYEDYNETYTIPASPGIYNVYMERILPPIANHSYAHFSVVDQTNGGLIPNAEIRLSDGQTKLTNSAGYAWFSVNNSEQINYYVSKPSGYWPAYGAMNLTADESILVALQRYTGPTATATMPGWTPVTVPTTGTGVDPVVTLSAQLRQQNVQEGMDVWYTNLPFISQFLFLLFIIGGLGLMAGGTRRN
jgi:hypothetical protein